MNKKTAKDYLPLVQALVDGKAVQIIDRDCNTWLDSDELDFRYPVSHYRIKPEPREIFVVNDDEDLAYWSEEDARRGGGRVVRYREVIE